MSLERSLAQLSSEPRGAERAETGRLISGDGDFAYAMSTLRNTRTQTVLGPRYYARAGPYL